MSVSSTTSRVTYNGDGSSVAFAFAYYFLANTDLVVIVRQADGSEATYILGVTYNVSGAGNPAGGTVTLTSPPPVGATITIYRDPAATQDLDLVENDPLPAEELEKRLDKLTMIIQRLQNRLDRGVTLSEGFPTAFDLKLPNVLTPSKSLAINDTGDGLALGPDATDIEQAGPNAAAAAASATQAQISQNAAFASASGASLSAAAAAASAASAASDATAAANSAVLTAIGRNFLINSSFRNWQRGTAITGIANGSSTYGPDRWYAKNSLGTNGVLRIDQTTGSLDGSRYGCSVKISTAPTAAQANGCELYQTLENADSILLYNKTASFSAQIKALGNVTQVGIQFFYKTTEAKVDTPIGSEVLRVVGTSGFSLASISGQALGTTQTTSGVIGVRIRPTSVSSGNLYDLNNGFVVEQAMLNLGSSAASYRPAGASFGEEISFCQRFFQKSWAPDTAIATVSRTDAHFWRCSTATAATTDVPIFFKIPLRAVPSMTFYNPNSGSTGSSRDESAGTDLSVSGTTTLGQNVCVAATASQTAGHVYDVHWTADAEI